MVLLLLSLLFNPLVWLLIIVPIVVFRHKPSATLTARMEANRAQNVPSTNPDNQPAAVLLDEMAQKSTNDVERDVLQRAAFSLRHGLHYLTTKATFRQSAAPEVPQTAAPIATAAHTVPAGVVAPHKATVEPSEPLPERGLKALQNINILLYLGAFFVVAAAGVFVGSTFSSLSEATKVFLLGLLAAIFYVSGLGLYALTQKIKPAGVTFTAIGLLLGPLVGVAAQNLLYAGQSVGPVWLITSAVLLVMQVVAFGVIRKSYIAYFAALTTISLFQAVTHTLQADVYWYGWAMLGTSLAYLLLSKVLKDEQLSSAFHTTAQIFVPISVLLSLIGIEQFGLWHVGIQLLFAAIFYFVGAALLNFDQSKDEVTYLTLAASIFPFALGLILLGRSFPHFGIMLILLTVAASYVMAEKLMPELKHRPIFGTLASILFSTAPLWLGEDTRLLVIGYGIVAVLHFGHYLLTQRREDYLLFLITLLALPGAMGVWVFDSASAVLIGTIYVGLAFILALTSQLLWRKQEETHHLAEMQDGFVLLFAAAGMGVSYLEGGGWWPALNGIGAGAVILYMSIMESPQLVIGTAFAWYVSLWSLGYYFEWSPLAYAWAHLGMASIFYAQKRLIPRLDTQPALMGILYGLGLGLTYLGALGVDQPLASVLVGIVVAAVVGISYSESLPKLSVVGYLMSFGLVIHVANQAELSIAISLAVWAVLLYGVGMLTRNERNERTDLLRLAALAGIYLAFIWSFNGENDWVQVSLHVLAGGLTMAESFVREHRVGKYIASVILWSACLSFYNAAGVKEGQVSIQTTAAYLAALAYRQYQRGQRQAQDILTGSALFCATVPLGIQALSDTTGGYTLGILGLGLGLVILGMSIHYPLVRNWGIATLIVIVLQRTAGYIFNLPAWVWLGVIGLGTLFGAIYLLSRRPHDPDTPKK